MTVKDRLLDGIAERDLKVVVLGIGYVGLPLAVALAEAGSRACGVDTSAERVNSINRGQSYIEYIPTTAVRNMVDQGRLWASIDFVEIADADAIVICVPTPLRKTKDPDITYIIDATDKIVKYGSKGKLVVLESTTYPGTTEEVVMPCLNSNGSYVGQDYFLAFSSVSIDPGRSDYVLANTSKVVGGMTDDFLEGAEVPAQAVELTAENLSNADCLVVITNHDGYDWRWITD